jgi:hypothetical protein
MESVCELRAKQVCSMWGLLYTQLKRSMFNNKFPIPVCIYIYIYVFSVTFGAEDTGCLILLACTVDVISNHVT